MKKNNQLQSSLHSDDLPEQTKRLIKEGSLYFDDNWQLITNSSSFRPKFVIFLVNPSNEHLKEHVCEQFGKVSDWFDREMELISNSKESVSEFFEYLKGLEFRIMAKMNDSSLFERWASYREFYILYLKVWNGNAYEPASLLSLVIKNLKSDKKIGFTGSGWVSKSYRTDINVKFALWKIHLAIFHIMNVNYGYGYVVDGNVKSLGSIEKTGMIPSKFKVSCVAIALDVDKRKNVNGKLFKKIDSFGEYEKFIYERFRNGLVYANLREFYDSPYFLGFNKLLVN